MHTDLVSYVLRLLLICKFILFPIGLQQFLFICTFLAYSGFYKLAGSYFVGDAEGTWSGTFLEVGKGTSEDCL